MIVGYKNVELIIDNNAIEHVTQFKLLGVWLDPNLPFTTHCVKLTSSINSYKYLLYKIETTMSFKYTTNDLYDSYMYSRLNYCLLVWEHIKLDRNQ